MRWLLIAIAAAGLLTVPGHIFSAAAGGGSGVPGFGGRFLDLPDGFAMTEEEEDTPEIIEFYNEEYEGDAFFFCLDKSDSMGANTSSGQPKWQVRNRETLKAIQAMSNRSVCTVLFFDHKSAMGRSDLIGDPPLKMDAAGKARAIAFVSSMRTANHPGSDSCIVPGMLQLLAIANKTNNEHRTCILVADGRAQCNGSEEQPDRVFQQIMAHNVLRIPINTIYTGQKSGADWERGASVLRRLAQATNGKFKVAD